MSNISTTMTITGQDRLGRILASRLTQGSGDLPHDITERLKAARMQALAKRKIVDLSIASVTGLNGNAGTLHMGDADSSLWTRLGSFLPLILLIVGLLAIGVLQENHRAHELAAVDAELLVDELPPAAYTDQGFMHYLNSVRRD